MSARLPLSSDSVLLVSYGLFGCNAFQSSLKFVPLLNETKLLSQRCICHFTEDSVTSLEENEFSFILNTDLSSDQVRKLKSVNSALHNLIVLI